MASSVASTSRVSLDEWDSLNALSATEQTSVSAVNERASQKPLPARLSKQQQNDRPETPLVRSRLLAAAAQHLVDGSPSASSQHGSPRPLSVDSFRQSEALRQLKEPVQTAQQFYDWFARVEAELEREQEDDVRQLLADYDRHVSACESMLEHLDDSRALLSEVEANYRHVDENSRALQLACESMLDEQRHLVDATQAIDQRLQHFRELDTATRMLSLPGESIVLEEDFLNMLDRLDACLDFLKANRDFKDSEIFIIRFQQCLTRAMTLIKMYSVSTIRRLANKALEKSAGRELSDAASNALYYGTFNEAAETLRILVSELEKRAAVDPQEYGTLLQEVLQAWFSARSSIISPQLATEVKRMEPANTDVIKLAHAGCNHLRSVCVQEHALFRKLFTSGEQPFYQFLEGLCDRLYDSLRPRILHEPRLETLCELCTILNAMMALDRRQLLELDDSDSEPDNDNDDDGDTIPNTSRKNSSATVAVPSKQQQKNNAGLKFSLLLQPILQDAQTRLVFRAESILQSDVVRYTPQPGDLDYPAKLEKSDETGLQLWTEDQDLQDASVVSGQKGATTIAVANEAAQATWYPTLRRTQYLLSRLHTYVNNAIFEDFAGEAVTLCRQSLEHAASLIRSSAPGGSTIDSHLFLIRHLVLLKEMVRSVDLTKVERLPDLRPVADAFVQLLSTSVLFNPNALFRLASQVIPVVFTETMVDAKTELDENLKAACESFLRDTAAGMTVRLGAFLDQCSKHLASTAAASGNAVAARDLSNEEFARKAKVLELDEAFRKQAREGCANVLSKLELYLKDPKTIHVLLPPLLDEVIDVYTTFFNLVRAEYDFATSSSLIQPDQLRNELAQVLGIPASTVPSTPQP